MQKLVIVNYKIDRTTDADIRRCALILLSVDHVFAELLALIAMRIGLRRRGAKLSPFSSFTATRAISIPLSQKPFRSMAGRIS